jgi:hypothetical protein
MVSYYCIEVSGACNIRCALCPSSYARDPGRPRGLMSVDLFEDILDKIRIERAGDEVIHPEIGRLMRSVGRRGMFPYISSNLSLRADIEELVASRPVRLRVSLSGFEQSVYERGHCRGNVELVKSNLREVCRQMELQGIDFPVDIYYHKYTYNCGEDLRACEEFARELGFNFVAVWAYVCGIEALLALLAGGADPSLAEPLCIKPEEALAVALGLRAQYPDCGLRNSPFAIDIDGSVPLCCAVYLRENYVHRDFLSASVEELEALKVESDLCRVCMEHAGDIYYQYGGQEDLDRIGEARLRE